MQKAKGRAGKVSRKTRHTFVSHHHKKLEGSLSSSAAAGGSTKENHRLNTPSVQPGERTTDLGASPIRLAAMDQRREFRELNARLQMLIQNRKGAKHEVVRLKQQLADNEVTHRQRMKELEKRLTLSMDDLSSENASLRGTNQNLKDKLNSLLSRADDGERRVREAEKKLSRRDAELELERKKVETIQVNLREITNEYIAYKASNTGDRGLVSKAREETKLWKDKHDLLASEILQLKSRHKREMDAHARKFGSKVDECDKLTIQLNRFKKNQKDEEQAVRDEFDRKMQSFVDKREEQYEQEKKEWMRIFKEEFTHKIQRYKEVNGDLVCSIKKKDDVIDDLRTRLSRVKKNKAEIEAIMRSQEDDLEKVRNDMDEMRARKDDEIRMKQGALQDALARLKGKEIEFNELATSKEQLDHEMQLYREILLNAEDEAGYMSPLAMRGKKRKLNNGNIEYIYTPGLMRARQVVQKDLDELATDGGETVTGMRDTVDLSAEEVRNNDNADDDDVDDVDDEDEDEEDSDAYGRDMDGRIPSDSVHVKREKEEMDMNEIAQEVEGMDSHGFSDGSGGIEIPAMERENGMDSKESGGMIGGAFSGLSSMMRGFTSRTTRGVFSDDSTMTETSGTGGNASENHGESSGNQNGRVTNRFRTRRGKKRKQPDPIVNDLHSHKLRSGRRYGLPPDLMANETGHEADDDEESAFSMPHHRNHHSLHHRHHPLAGQKESFLDSPEQPPPLSSSSSLSSKNGSFSIQFSTLDLNDSLLELQNVSSSPVSLAGYVLTNSNGTEKFHLPDRILNANERVRVIVGTNGIEPSPDDIWWQGNVWSGKRDDIARLYNANNQQIAQIQISTDMLPAGRDSKGCYVM